MCIRDSPTAVFTQYGLPCAFTSNLPFELTRAQKRTIQDIHRSLSSGKVMNRLIQGDVGSGKTVVAIWALLAAVDNGYQGAFLAPTEVLARQHKRTVENLAGNFAQIGFLSGSMRAVSYTHLDVYKRQFVRTAHVVLDVIAGQQPLSLDN